MSHFILEIGTEELPARFLSSVEKELVTRFSEKLDELKLSYKSIESHSTPRRCILHIYDLEKIQEKHEEIAMGPSVNIAYGADGNLTKAGEGFVRGQKASLDDIFKTSNEKGEYIAVRKQVGGKMATEVLAEICPLIINALPFPKRMRWGKESFAYARPLHWIVAMLDDEPIKFTVGKIESSTQTFGHRIHGIGPFNVKHADELETLLFEKSQIVCDAKKRRAIIIQDSDKAAHELQSDASIIWNERLLDEVQGLVEKPVPLIGNFENDFLELPKEVLLTSMEHHQKCFGLEDANKALLPKFLTVLNIEPESREVVREGWERVLRARLEDARFYWKEDLKDGFSQWLEMLDKVIFLGPLGSMGDKSRRLEKLCGWLAEKIDLKSKTKLDNAIELAQRAGRFSKADLMSKMVGEFDTLQGIMGGIYAQKDGFEAPYTTALREQYLPTGPESMLPSNDLGAILSISDKVDTLIGCFGLGNIPTGTADPYALRRAALGISRILIEYGYQISLSELFEKAYSFYSPEIKWKFKKEETLEKVSEFCAARLKNLFVGEGSETLVAEAIMSAKDKGKLESDMIWETAQRLNALKEAMTQADFADNAQALKRITNILAKSTSTLADSFSESLFEADCEHALGKSIKEFATEFDKHWNNHAYNQVMPLMNKVLPQLEAFFEGVMIMAEDEKVRQNRMNMLSILMTRMGKLADFAVLQM